MICIPYKYICLRICPEQLFLYKYDGSINARCEKKKKNETPVPARDGKKKCKMKGPEAANKLPQPTLHTRCRLKLLKLERIKDFLLMENNS